MDWTRAVNAYCERAEPGFWAEPVNALTNAAFLVAAARVWPMTRGDGGARLLAVVLALIGIGSFLFHTLAQVWAGLADVAPILAFILVYTYLATTRFLGGPRWAGLLAAALYLPFSALVSGAAERVAGSLNGSANYLPVVVLIGAYALILRPRAPATARGLAAGLAVLLVSLAFRTVDSAVCASFPLGTHFLWHLLNAAMLGWMIRVLVRHRAGPGLAPRAGAG
ncbi:ceramidase domain-containing protein [Amaricoccus solimangrovi]|uniref:Ceramidase n=1 Tax=Amaricoccus solimangrovi TaxID=2589815 RepID=A0A501WU65_9RHOB|nr:ceramidase domain-containing protein [Amaricoccus solimangrovi]TPE50511.1 hypothetical protein FJM51_12015 [Amaricoccus solimangrovi]